VAIWAADPILDYLVAVNAQGTKTLAYVDLKAKAATIR
jgi:hypothetical protein